MRSEMKNIVLTGFMGTGKTAVGRELARLLDMRLIDVDTEIENSRNITINEIFRESGEPVFREIETDMIKKVSRNKQVIISTGGGAVLKQENMETLREGRAVLTKDPCSMWRIPWRRSGSFWISGNHFMRKRI
jgi:shikimate kinase